MSELTIALEKVASFLLSNTPLIALIEEAINGGVTHESLMTAIKAEMVKASDAAITAKLG